MLMFQAVFVWVLAWVITQGLGRIGRRALRMDKD
jgi:hypothetical protein